MMGEVPPFMGGGTGEIPPKIGGGSGEGAPKGLKTAQNQGSKTLQNTPNEVLTTLKINEISENTPTHPHKEGEVPPFEGGGTPEIPPGTPHPPGYTQYILGINNNSILEEDIGSKNIDQDQSVKTNLDSNGFENPFPLFPNKKNWGLLLPQHQVDIVIEWFFRASHLTMEPDRVLGLWEVFKKIHFDGHHSYKDPGDAHSHFFNWVIKQNLKKLSDDTNQQTTQKRDRQSGAKQLIQKLKQQTPAPGSGHDEG